jgi:hypothetical protein
VASGWLLVTSINSQILLRQVVTDSFNNMTQNGQVIFADPKNCLSINVEVMVSDNIPQALCFLPVDLMVVYEQFPICQLVDMFQNFTNID